MQTLLVYCVRPQAQYSSAAPFIITPHKVSCTVSGMVFRHFDKWEFSQRYRFYRFPNRWFLLHQRYSRRYHARAIWSFFPQINKEPHHPALRPGISIRLFLELCLAFTHQTFFRHQTQCCGSDILSVKNLRPSDFCTITETLIMRFSSPFPFLISSAIFIVFDCAPQSLFAGSFF